MKKGIKSFLCILILFIFTAIININDVKAETKITVENISIKEKSDNITVNDPILESNQITSNISFNEPDDYVIFELILKNNEEEKYKIDSINDNNTNENIEIEYEYDKEYIESGKTSSVKIKMKYKNKLFNVEKISLNDLNIILNLSKEDGTNSTITINPVTGDFIAHYLVLLIISLSGLILIHKKSKLGKLLLIIAIISLPLITFAKEIFEIKIKFTDIEIKGELETYEIKIDSNNGNPLEIKNIKYGEKLGELQTPNKEGYNFIGWKDNNGNEITEDTIITEPIEITAQYNIIEYQINYDLDGGTAENPSKYTIEDEITLNNPTKDGYKFIGWTENNTTQLETNVKIEKGTTGEKNYKANYEKTALCKLATTLHTGECNRTSKGCYDAGYTENGSKATKTITYGNIASSNTYQAGDAYDCDINGDGEYNSETERFYYLRNNGENEVLIYYSNFEGTDGPKNENIFLYEDALDKLPTTEQWNRISTTFNDKAARLLKEEDIENACTQPLTQKGSIDSCVYLFENTKYEDENNGRSAIWLEKKENQLIRIHSATRNLVTIEPTSKNGVRPVIEVPTNLIEKNKETQKVTITFDSNGGNNIESKEITKNTNIGELPIPIKDDHIFNGWYTDTTYTTKIESNYIVSENTTFYAKWTLRDDVAKIGEKYYTTIQKAIDAVPIDGTETTIKIIKDVELTTTINLNNTNAESKNIVIDLQEHTISNNTTNVIKSKATLEIKNGTISSKAGSGAIDIEEGGTLIINSGNIIATGSRQAIYNNGGTVEIGGTTYISSSAAEEKRGTVHNVSGTLKITGGTIISDTFNAVKVDAGTLIIGTEDGTYNKTTPVIQGNTYGISTTKNIEIYDGIIKGKTNAINDESKITKIEAGTTKIKTTESSYETLYYSLD